MSRLERLGALHVDIEVPRSSMTAVEVVPDGIKALRGMRAPGTGIPGYLMLGTTRGSFGRDFCAVKGHGPALVVSLRDQAFSRLLVSTSDATALAQQLRGGESSDLTQSLNPRQH